MHIPSSRQPLCRSLVTMILISVASLAQAIDWPQEITRDEGTIIVYQPQLETLQGNVLKGRAAMALELNDSDEPTFGAFWFSSKIDTDTEAGIVSIRDLQVTDVRWPESTDASEQQFTTIVNAAIPATGFEISMERLSSSIESAETVQASLESIKNDPPIIVFREELAVLLMYDGEPRYSDIENSPYERVLNTPFAVVREKSSQRMHLISGDFWYASDDPMGPWTFTESPPDDLAQMVEQAQEESNAENNSAGMSPAIVTAVEPTELIVTDGSPDWQSLPGGELLYVRNTESPWLRELSTGNMYLLLSGRWFRSTAQAGPWTFVRADELPESFADIPPASDLGGLRVSVAGTEEANDAMLDAQIPQTAAIERDKASLTVEYDGEPKFEQIEGTDVLFAVNTGAQVLKIANSFYAVDDGVWFRADSAMGPWEVADSIPQDQINEIPPSSPVYNVTHVHVYESTPEVVYVGYTPGYMWSYPYYGVPVYGTGWYYPPYYGSFYYPRPPTWGFHVGYNPWTGWNFGLSWSNGFFSMGIAWGGGYGGAYRPWGCCGGFYGGGYRGPTIINTGNINIGNNVNIGNRVEARNRIDRSNNNFNRGGARTNLYDRADNRARNAAPATARQNLSTARPASNRANNVYADRNGNVARRSGNNWQTRSNGNWESNRATSNSSLSTRQGAGNRSIDRSGLNRSYQSRQHGTSRQMARPSRMGGGMRRRR